MTSIRGIALDQESGEGIARLRVELRDLEGLVEGPVGTTTTSPSGAFRIAFDLDMLVERYDGEQPYLYFRFYQGGERLHSTEEEAFQWHDGIERQKLEVVVPGFHVREEAEFLVYGRITSPNGKPLGNAYVRALEMVARSQEILGRTRTNEAGRYEIAYTRPVNSTTSLVVQVLDEETGEVLVQSPPTIQADAEHVVDLVVQGEAESGRMKMKVRELLALEQNTALSFIELQRTQPQLAARLQPRLDARIRRKARARLPIRSEKMQGLLTEITFTVTPASARIGLGKATVAGLRLRIEQDETLAGDEEIRRELEDLEQAIHGAEEVTLAEELHLDRPLGAHPAFQRELEAVQLCRLGVVAGLGEDKIAPLVDESGAIDGVDNGHLRALVKEEALSHAEAKSVGHAVDLYHLFDGQMELVVPVGMEISSTRDLVKKDTSDWVALCEEYAVTPPGELSTEEYAETLVEECESLFPTDALAHRISQTDVGTALEDARQLDVLRARNPTISLARAKDFDTLDTSALSEEERSAARQHYENTVRFVNRYTGMPLIQAFESGEVSEQDRNRMVLKTVGMANDFFEQNQDLLDLNLTTGSDDLRGLRFAPDATEQEKGGLLSMARTYQRAMTVTGNISHAQAFVAAGYSSALFIATSDPEELVSDTGLDRSAIGNILIKAGEISQGVVLGVGSINDLMTDDRHETNVGNRNEEIQEYLKQIPGFADFFGNLSYCQCEHCQSIFGPAAYFVDLMAFIDEKITQKYFSQKSDHPLNLKTRRPDLWALELTCKNTNTVIPYLTIINEILENAVAQDAGFVGDYGDRRAVRSTVYMETLPENVSSFEQPFHLPMAELRTYLAHFERTLADLAEAGNARGNTLARLRLGLSPKEFDLITHPVQDIESLRTLYGINFQETTPPHIHSFSAHLLLRSMDVNRQQMGALAGTRFVTSDGAANFRIEMGKRRGSVQSDVERPIGLTRDVLDRMHRFVRLWRATGWRIGELDLVLSHLQQAGVAGVMGTAVVRSVARLHRLQSTLGISVAELTALWSSLPGDLFARSYNQTWFVAADGEYPKDTTVFLHPALASAPPAMLDHNLPRLQAGTGCDEDQLYELIVGLAAPLGIDPGATQDSKKRFALNLRNLSLLYRHARLARLLKITISELFALAELAPEISHGHIDGIGDLAALLRIHTWWRATDWDLADLLLFVRSPVSMGEKQMVLAKALVEQVEAKKALVFSDSLFAYIDPITEEQSRAIVAANVDGIEAADNEGHYRLNADFSPRAKLIVPETVAAELEPTLRQRLLDYHSQALLLAELPGTMGLDAELVPALTDMLNEDLSDRGYLQELRKDSTTPSRVAALISRVQRLAKLVTHRQALGADALYFIKEQATLFGITDFRQIPLDGIRRLETYRTLYTAWTEAGRATTELNTALAAFDPVDRFGHADLETLAVILGCESSLLNSLQQHLDLSETPFEALWELLSAIAVAQDLGIGGAALKQVQSHAYEDIANASAALQGALRAKYEREEDWLENSEPYRDALLSLCRDGLLAYMIRSSATPHDEVTDLYHYLLIDVELEGCARTSRVAAAIASLQLYIQRCTMNLEETPTGHDDPVHVLPECITPEEWAWRKNYRLWEANRKVFLYPENWIEPELRDNKTPLFEAFEEEVLANGANDEALLEAYARYLRGFDEVANLSIAGSFHEKGAETDVLHLFGVTADEPPVYYYRRVENIEAGLAGTGYTTRWAPWKKLDLQIPVRKVAPVIHNSQLYVFWVHYVTKPTNTLNNGDSEFTGYQHRMYVEFSRRKLDGSWTAPQSVGLTERPFRGHGEGVIDDPLVGSDGYKLPYYTNQLVSHQDEVHNRPKEGYSLSGFGWDQVYPESVIVDAKMNAELRLRGRYFRMWQRLDLYHRSVGKSVLIPWLPPKLEYLYGRKNDSRGAETQYQEICNRFPRHLIWSKRSNGELALHSAGIKWRRTPHSSGKKPLYSRTWPAFEAYTFTSVLLEEDRINGLESYWPYSLEQQHSGVNPIDGLESRLIENKLGSLPSNGVQLDVVNGSVGDVIIHTDKEVREILYLQLTSRRSKRSRYRLSRLNTSLSAEITSTLFNRGLDALLNTRTQLDLQEADHALTIINKQLILDKTHTGEVDYGGSMGVYLREIFFHIPFLIANHQNSQGKYEEAQRWYHFIFDPTTTEIFDASESRDRPWRYREFHKITLETLRQRLTDQNAISEYKRDPFNPHAIARSRLGAYQKAIVMKYIDNLLDWGDHLFALAFAQQNAECLREATLKYVVAQEILGDRPTQLGSCSSQHTQPYTFATLQEVLRNGSEFLVEVESLVMTPQQQNGRTSSDDDYVSVPPADSPLPYVKGAKNPQQPQGAGEPTVSLNQDNPVQASIIDQEPSAVGFGAPQFLQAMIRETGLAFCIPGNERMLTYWDRVADRLYKLRHCMDIDGVYRQLPLFAPPIDPGLLVRARAAGINLQDLYGANDGSLPPYRFRYLIEKAKGYAATVQAFGSALLRALEQRDAADLVEISNVHQKNILALTTENRRNELKIAAESVGIVQQREAAAQYRFNYYESLISTGLTPAEILEKATRVHARVASVEQSVLEAGAAVVYLMPQLGSFFAMKFGGKELGDSMKAAAAIMGTLAKTYDMVATISSIAAGFERREEGWTHQRELAKHDLAVLEREGLVADLRQAIAVQALEIHEKTREQHDEVLEFQRDKFSNLGLYTYLANSLQDLYREAYADAQSLARLAEQAYRFERPADDSWFVGGEWDASRAGLLAGERLQLALQRMEKRYIETSDRQLEIVQNFSLNQIDPAALIALKESGHCEFSLPEFYFDLSYPGHYRRRIKAVRLTMPCIRGPYTNIGAKLTLLESKIRAEAKTGDANLMPVPPTRTTSVATSNAQNDAGVFELNFRGERYMPFEGAGAVSTWQLELPANFRPFDYRSISDVILNISYTAAEDGMLRQTVEANNSELEGALLEYVSANSLTRMFSLRYDFSSEFNRLVRSPVGTPVTIDITDRHFPLFVQGRTPKVDKADMVLVVGESQGVSNVSVSLNAKAFSGFARDAAYGGLPSKMGVKTAFGDGLQASHELCITSAGTLADGVAGKLEDVLLIIDYSL